MVFATALMLAAAPVGAKLILPSAQGPLVVNYPTMARCLAAKAAYIRQMREQAEENRRRNGAVLVGEPAIICIPA